MNLPAFDWEDWRFRWCYEVPPKTGSLRPRIAIFPRLEFHHRWAKIAGKTTDWILKRPPFRAININGSNAGINNGKRFKKCHISFFSPPSSPRYRKGGTWRSS